MSGEQKVVDPLFSDKQNDGHGEFDPSGHLHGRFDPSGHMHGAFDPSKHVHGL